MLRQNCVPNGLGGGVCKPLGTKPTSGNPCTMNSQCATSYCNNGVCSNPSFCTVSGDICSTDAQCCGGLCSKLAGAAVGICKTVTTGGGVVGGACLPAGELCSPNGTCTGADCCGRSCAPSPTSGLGVCQPESGCHIIGDLCTSTVECCGNKDLPGSIKGGAGGPSTDVQCQKIGRTDLRRLQLRDDGVQPGRCALQAGQRLGRRLGIVQHEGRLLRRQRQPVPDVPDRRERHPALHGHVQPELHDQAPGGYAVRVERRLLRWRLHPQRGPGTVATKPYVCGTPGVCQPQGATCTATSDCCKGLPCAVPPGAVSGICGGTLLPDGGVATTPPPGTDGGVVVPPTDGGADAAPPPVCALYGQTCTVAGDCCSGVPCTGTAGSATCHFP